MAAQEAARAAVLAPDPAAAAADGAALVATVAANHGVPADDVGICWAVHGAGSPPPPCTGLVALDRGGAVTARVTVELPAIALPGLDVTLGSVARTVVHTELVDRYRSFAR